MIWCRVARNSVYRSVYLTFISILHAVKKRPDDLREDSVHGKATNAHVRKRGTGDARETRPESAPDRFRRDLRRVRDREGRGAGRALFAVRRTLLPDALPAAQQHSRLAQADRRGAAARGV